MNEKIKTIENILHHMKIRIGPNFLKIIILVIPIRKFKIVMLFKLIN